MHYYRFLAIPLIICLCATAARAQDADSVHALLHQPLDSIHQVTGSLNGASDSLAMGPRHSLDSVQNAAAGALQDVQNSYDSVNTVANRAMTGIQHRMDSLNALQLSTEGLTGELDSVAQWKAQKLNTLDQKSEKLKQQFTQKIDSLDLPDDLQAEAKALTAKIDGVNIADPTTALPTVGIDSPLAGLSTSGLGNLTSEIDNPLAGTDGVLGDTDLGDTGLTNLGSVEMPDEVSEVTGQVQEVTSAVPQNVEDIPGAVEQQVTNIDEVSELQGELGDLGEAGELQQSVKSLQDPDALKSQATAEVKKQAINHFAGKEEQLKAAMEKMAKYKKKYSSVQSLAELPKKRLNEMRNKPFIERLVPGITLQVSGGDAWTADFNPYVGYRFTTRLAAGVGWVQRVAYDRDHHDFSPALRIYGPRAYGEYKIAKGFSGHLNVEYVNTYVPPRFSSNPSDPEGREWVFSTMAGIKKQYHFLKRVNGTIYLLYNLYDPDNRSPYSDRLVTRIGFEFPFKKKPRKKSE